MMKFVLISMICGTGLVAYAGNPHWENHKGILYWIDENGIWYARGKANLALSDPVPLIDSGESIESYKARLEAWTKRHPNYNLGRTTSEILEDIATDLSNIEMDLNQ